MKSAFEFDTFVWALEQPAEAPLAKRLQCLAVSGFLSTQMAQVCDMQTLGDLSDISGKSVQVHKLDSHDAITACAPLRRLCVNIVVTSASVWTSCAQANNWICFDTTNIVESSVERRTSAVLLEIMSLAIRCVKALDFRPICVRASAQEAVMAHTMMFETCQQYLSVKCIACNSQHILSRMIREHMRSKLFSNSLGLF